MDGELEKKLDEIIMLLRGITLTTAKGAGISDKELDVLEVRMQAIDAELSCQK